MKINVVQLILQACGGDVIQAIEQILTKYKPENFGSTHLPIESHDLSKDLQWRADPFHFARAPPNFFSSFHSSAFSPVSVYPKYQPSSFPIKAKYFEESANRQTSQASHNLDSRDYMSHSSSTSAARLEKLSDVDDRSETNTENN